MDSRFGQLESEGMDKGLFNENFFSIEGDNLELRFGMPNQRIYELKIG